VRRQLHDPPVVARRVVGVEPPAEAAAKLHQTNSVPVYAAGEEGGVNFYFVRPGAIRSRFSFMAAVMKGNQIVPCRQADDSPALPEYAANHP
jgi:hypothetical protein